MMGGEEERMAISSPSFLINATLFFGLSTRHIPQEVLKVLKEYLLY